MKTAIFNGKFIDTNYDSIKKLGEVVIAGNKTDEELYSHREELKDVDALYFVSFKLQNKVLELCPNLKVISLSSTGYDWIRQEVLDYTREHNIAICNNPVYGSAAVAQHAFALLMELTNAMAIHDESVRNGDWVGPNRDYWLKPLTEMSGKTMGIIGCGNIGAKMAKMALGFEMNVITYSEYVHESVKDMVEQVSLDELYERSDFISLHCPLFDSTREMINRESIAKMKKGALLLNAARGGLINEQDVADALKSGQLGGYGADAFTVEPIKPENPLLDAPNCVLTPHIAWSSVESRQRQIDNAADNIRSYMEGNPKNVINL